MTRRTRRNHTPGFKAKVALAAVKAGSAFVGSVLGDGGTLDLASGTGTPTNLLAGGNVTVSGSMALTTFTNFATVEVGAVASFTVAGDSAVGAGQNLIDAGTVTVSGTIDQSGRVTIGGGTSAAATLTIAAGATWDIENNSGIALGLSTKSSIKNSGTLIKAGGTAPSIIGVKVIDTGSMEAASGTLDFTQAITGTGAMSVDSGATLEVDSTAASALRMTFKGGNAILALSDPSAFAATIHGFAPTDTIELIRIHATSAVLGTGDTLVITDGTNPVATLQLAGTFTGDTSNVASNGNIGTNITVTTGVAHVPPPSPGHQFVGAMAVFGAQAGGHGVPAVEPWRTQPHILAAPRFQIA